MILRAVNTVDAMTATVEPLEFALLQKITNRIVNEVPGVNRVLYDLKMCIRDRSTCMSKRFVRSWEMRSSPRFGVSGTK